MENLFIEATKSTPEVKFDFENKKLSIKGESYPENSFDFYNPIFDWLDNYFKNIDKSTKTIFDFDITYLNTSSTKSFMYILEKLEEESQNGYDIEINWYYDDDNELSYELGEEFSEDLDINFNLIEKS